MSVNGKLILSDFLIVCESSDFLVMVGKISHIYEIHLQLAEYAEQGKLVPS